MENEMNLRDRVIKAIIDSLGDTPLTAYQINKKTGINLTTAAQIINRNFNPTFNTLLEMEKKYCNK